MKYERKRQYANFSPVFSFPHTMHNEAQEAIEQLSTAFSLAPNGMYLLM